MYKQINNATRKPAQYYNYLHTLFQCFHYPSPQKGLKHHLWSFYREVSATYPNTKDCQWNIKLMSAYYSARRGAWSLRFFVGDERTRTWEEISSHYWTTGGCQGETNEGNQPTTLSRARNTQQLSSASIKAADIKNYPILYYL